jgi:hypothetical protein
MCPAQARSIDALAARAAMSRRNFNMFDAR